MIYCYQRAWVEYLNFVLEVIFNIDFFYDFIGTIALNAGVVKPLCNSPQNR